MKANVLGNIFHPMLDLQIFQEPKNRSYKILYTIKLILQDGHLSARYSYLRRYSMVHNFLKFAYFLGFLNTVYFVLFFDILNNHETIWPSYQQEYRIAYRVMDASFFIR